MKLALALTFAGCAGHAATTPMPTTPTLTVAIDTANRTQRPLVAEFGATWCKPCHVFAEQVLTDPRVVAALGGVTFVQYDIETPVGADAMRRCEITGVPAIVSLDRAGSVRARKAGAALTSDEFLAFLRDVR